MLLLADRNFPSVRLWRLFTGAGADLVWRAKEPVANRIVSRLADGSYLAKFGDGKQALTVRVIEYALPGPTVIYRLLTNLLDPLMAPARGGGALRRALGDRDLLRRAQGRPIGAARARPPGVLGSLRPLPRQPPARLPGCHGDPGPGLRPHLLHRRARRSPSRRPTGHRANRAPGHRRPARPHSRADGRAGAPQASGSRLPTVPAGHLS